MSMRTSCDFDLHDNNFSYYSSLRCIKDHDYKANGLNDYFS